LRIDRVRKYGGKTMQREAKDDPSAEVQERWLRIKAEYERLARQWQRRIGGVV
jgi:hypothetical protein